MRRAAVTVAIKLEVNLMPAWCGSARPRTAGGTPKASVRPVPRGRVGNFPAMTSMKARLAAGETLFGTFLTLGSPLAAEALGMLGWDWLLVDLEHGGGDESLLVSQLMGARAAGVHALARVESD